MLDHTGIVVTDLPKARAFYDAVARALGLGIVTPHKDFFLLGRGPGQIPYLWIGILRPSYWAEDNGKPGPREAGYYGAFVLDPDGNNIEAVARG
jgi:catechol 2,3-dioxygenase-like lactoylglutathione lyase family enzyme